MSSVAVPLTRNSDFMKLWIGETISMAGSALTMLALPLTALRLLHATPFDMGLLLACSAGARALTGLFAGVLADRLPRRLLLLLADSGRALLIGAIPLAYLEGVLVLPMLFVVAALTGLLDSLFGAAYTGFLPDLVGQEGIVGANSRFEGSRVLAMVLGGLLSGILITLLTAPVTLLIDAASFVVGAGAILMIQHRGQVARSEKRSHFWQDLRTGLAFIGGSPVLRTILLMAGLFNLFAPMLNSQLVLYITGVLDLSPIVFGVGLTVGGSMGVLMAILAPRIVARIGTRRAVVVAAGVVALGWSLIPLAGGSFAVLIGMLLAGVGIGTMGDVLLNISAGSLQQQVTPAELQGRVGAGIGVVVAALQPLGAIAGGLIAQYYGVRPAFFIFGGGFVLTFVLLVFSPLRRKA